MEQKALVELESQRIWDRPNPYVLVRQADKSEVDRLGHVNNTAYLQWMEEVSWEHIAPLGMDWESHQRLGKAMAITRTEIDYLASAYEGEWIAVGTWITGCDDRLTSSRAFQLIRLSDHKVLVRANCRYACITLQSGRPTRMPQEFVQCHHKAMAKAGSS